MRLTLLSTIFFACIGSSSFSQSGILDQGFGNQGKVIANLGYDEISKCTIVQPDGKILVAGSINATGQPADFLVLRYKTDGTLDSTFANKGRKRIDFKKK